MGILLFTSLLLATAPFLDFCTCWKPADGPPMFYRFAIYSSGTTYQAHWMVAGEARPDSRHGNGIPVVRWDAGILLQSDVDSIAALIRNAARAKLVSSPLRPVVPRQSGSESWLEFAGGGKPLQFHFNAGPMLEEDQNDEPIPSEAPRKVQELLQAIWDSHSWMKNSRAAKEKPRPITGYCFKGWAQREANAVIERSWHRIQSAP